MVQKYDNILCRSGYEKMDIITDETENWCNILEHNFALHAKSHKKYLYLDFWNNGSLKTGLQNLPPTN